MYLMNLTHTFSTAKQQQQQSFFTVCTKLLRMPLLVMLSDCAILKLPVGQGSRMCQILFLKDVPCLSKSPYHLAALLGDKLPKDEHTDREETRL